METVDRLVSALALHGEETGSHIQRMSRYAAVLARQRGIETWTEDEIRIAAMLHDVGKIGIPDSILLKPGSLTEAELDVIRRHCDMGATLLAGGTSRVLVLGRRIALTHHEHWDGSGYPAGLAGDNIPIEGRIAMIADVFDALTSHRVYRPAMSINEAVEMMRAERGRQLDPELLELFEASLDEMLAIRDSYAEPTFDHQHIAVLLIDARRMFAGAIARLLTDTDGITVIGSAATSADGVALARERSPDVVVIDAELPDDHGVTTADRIRTEQPGIAVILLSTSNDDELLLRALDVGCAGVITRDRAFDELLPAILVAHTGEPLVPAARLLSLLNRRRSPDPDVGQLTRREVEVLHLMAEGLANDIIAQRLILSLNTVRNHVQRILNKLGAHSKLEAVVEADRRGLLDTHA
jgi:response regulator RpfG family c-di-GMP phosphodiesterase